MSIALVMKIARLVILEQVCAFSVNMDIFLKIINAKNNASLFNIITTSSINNLFAIKIIINQNK